MIKFSWNDLSFISFGIWIFVRKIFLSCSEYSILAKQFFKKSVEREYLALVWGDVKNDEGEINAPIGRNPKNRLQMIVYEDLEGGKDAITN